MKAFKEFAAFSAGITTANCTAFMTVLAARWLGVPVSNDTLWISASITAAIMFIEVGKQNSRRK